MDVRRVPSRSVDPASDLQCATHAALPRKLWRPAQLFRSWDVLFFQLPRLPEFVLSFRDFHVVRDMFARMPARPGAFTPDDIDQYVRALSAPGALTAALDYYRANLRRGGAGLAQSATIEADTLVLWGERIQRSRLACRTASTASCPACRCGGFPTWVTGSRTKRRTR